MFTAPHRRIFSWYKINGYMETKMNPLYIHVILLKLYWKSCLMSWWKFLIQTCIDQEVISIIFKPCVHI